MPNSPENSPQPIETQPKGPKASLDLPKTEVKVDFKSGSEKEITDTLDRLGGNKVASENFRLAIIESLKTQNYGSEKPQSGTDKAANDRQLLTTFWKEIAGAPYNCASVEYKDNHINFLNKNGERVAPKQTSIKIEMSPHFSA